MSDDDKENVMMDEIKNIAKHKGGRPKQAVKRSQQLAVMCTMIERKIIEHKAKASGMCLSEYLRTLALNIQADRKIKLLPKEVLMMTEIIYNDW